MAHKNSIVMGSSKITVGVNARLVKKKKKNHLNVFANKTIVNKSYGHLQYLYKSQQ